MSFAVTEEAIALMNNLSASLEEEMAQINEITKKLRNAFDTNRAGLGAHTEDISNLLDDVESEESDAQKPVKKLVLKLTRASLIRRGHLDNNVYGNNKSR